MLSACLLVQYALHRLEERAGIDRNRSAIARALQDPLTASFDYRLRPEHFIQRTPHRISCGNEVVSKATSDGRKPELMNDGLADNELLKHALKISASSSQVQFPARQARFRGQKPASLSNLRYTATTGEHKTDDQIKSPVSCWSPVSEDEDISAENTKSVYRLTPISPRSMKSPRSPRSFRLGTKLDKGVRSPLFSAMEDGFRALMSNGSMKSPGSFSAKRASSLKSPGLSVITEESSKSSIRKVRSPLSPISPVPRTPKRLSGFVVAKKTTKSVFQSPKRARFESVGTGRGMGSPRKLNFDDEGFNDTYDTARVD